MTGAVEQTKERVENRSTPAACGSQVIRWFVHGKQSNDAAWLFVSVSVQGCARHLQSGRIIENSASGDRA